MAENSKAKAASQAANIHDQNLSMAISQIEREFGKGSIMCLGDKRAAAADVPVISTGALSLDLALGVGGVPRGRITEIYGPESSGKTTVCLHVIANAQRDGGSCAIIDAEHAIDPHYAERIGVNLDKLLISQPDSGEDALNIAERLVRSNAIDVLVIDSVAALVPKAELDGQMGDAHVGLQARLMSQALRKITGAVNRSNTCVIFTNQIRMKIGVMFGNPETTAGGNALKFYSSVRMDIRRVSSIKNNANEVVGSRTRVKVVKNKLAPPFRDCEFDIMYSEGISWANSVVETALDYGVFEKKGSWIFFDGQQIGQGREQVKELVVKDPAFVQKLVEKVWAADLASKPPRRSALSAEPADGADGAPSADSDPA